MKYTKTFLILTALFGGLQSSLTYADHTESSKEQKMTMESKQEQQIYLSCRWLFLGTRSLYGTHSGRDRCCFGLC